MHSVSYDGYFINPIDKEALLRPSEYESVNDYMRPFINKMLGRNQGELF